MESFSLLRDERKLGEFLLGDLPVEIGSDPDCDVTIYREQLAPRAVLLRLCGTAVQAIDLTQAPYKSRHLPRGGRFCLGGHVSIKRLAPEVITAPTCAQLVTQKRSPVNVSHETYALVVSSPLHNRTIALADNAIVTIGSCRESDMVLEDRTVSRHHCRIEPTDSGFSVRDLRSKNGTYVNGIRIRQALLRGGEVMRLGQSNIRFVDTSVSERSLVYASQKMEKALAEVRCCASLRWPLLLFGESGVGKEALARLAHEASPRRDGPFVAINAGGLARQLIEAELFGYEKGSFTGAAATHQGAFEQADGGTLFLDEVGELTASAQSRLLRAVENGEIRRVGADKTRQVDVRLVCATHRDLPALVRQGSFRLDLYYRIARLVVCVPPLRERARDIPVIAEQFLNRIASEVGAKRLRQDALDALMTHQWPGNARELLNVISHAAAFCVGDEIHAAAVADAIQRLDAQCRPPNSLQQVQQVLERHGGNVAAAARALGIPRTTLRDRLKDSRSSEPIL